MNDFRYRLINVFTVNGNRLSGNPLCVFEDGAGLDEATMQALALQFNLSETTFILPSERATARVRIFTPAFELPFAGHPVLGTAHAVRAITGTGDALTLETQAGLIPVRAQRDSWTLQAKPATSRPVDATRDQLAAMLGLDVADMGAPPLWVDAGTEQLVIPLTSPEAVARCQPDVPLLRQYGRLSGDRYMAYVWAPGQGEEVRARFFFPKGSAIAEDPATGSACANLGGWFVATRAELPLAREVHQGDAVGRPSRLGLRIDAEQRIYVSGQVIEIGSGTIRI